MIPTDIVEELLDRLAFCIQHGTINERLIDQRDYILRYIEHLRSGETIIELEDINNEHKELDSNLQVLQESSRSETE